MEQPSKLFGNTDKLALNKCSTEIWKKQKLRQTCEPSPGRNVFFSVIQKKVHIFKQLCDNSWVEVSTQTGNHVDPCFWQVSTSQRPLGTQICYHNAQVPLALQCQCYWKRRKEKKRNEWKWCNVRSFRNIPCWCLITKVHQILGGWNHFR